MTVPASIRLALCPLSNVHISRITSLASNLCSIEYKVLFLILKAQLRVAPKYLLDSTRYTFSATSLRPLRSLNRRDLLSSLFPVLGLWLRLGLSLLFVPPCGIFFRRPLAISSSLLICPPF